MDRAADLIGRRCGRERPAGMGDGRQAMNRGRCLEVRSLAKADGWDVGRGMRLAAGRGSFPPESREANYRK